jgi:hypothetical protein
LVGCNGDSDRADGCVTSTDGSEVTGVGGSDVVSFDGSGVIGFDGGGVISSDGGRVISFDGGGVKLLTLVDTLDSMSFIFDECFGSRGNEGGMVSDKSNGSDVDEDDKDDDDADGDGGDGDMPPELKGGSSVSVYDLGRNL